MSILSRIAGSLWRRGRLTSDLADEMAFHIEERTRENLARGMSPEAAHFDAAQRFGNSAIIMDRARDADVVTWLDTLVRESQQALRSLSRRPGLVFTTVLVLGLGIGTTSAMFSVVDAVLLKPLPLPDGESVVVLREAIRGEGLGGNPARLRDWRARMRTVTSLAGSYGEAVTLTGGGEPERLRVLRTFGPALPMLGLAPMVGRAFTEEEENGGGAPVAIATHGLWQRRFGGRPELLGRTLTLNSISYTVIGILPREFAYPENQDLIIPAAAEFQNADRKGGNYLAMLGRLAPGSTLAGANAEARALAGSLAREFPDVDRDLSAEVISLQRAETEGAREPLMALLGAVGMVLLIACVNITSLLMARAGERQHEAAIRTALGAGRASLVRLYLLESAWLAVGGGGAGLALARVGVPVLQHILPGDLPRIAEAGLDWRVTLFAVAATIGSALLFGTVPAWQATRSRATRAGLREGGRNTAGPRRLVARQLMVGAQVALSMILLVAAALLGRSLYRMRSMATGVAPESVLAVRLEYPWDITSTRLHQIYRRALQTLDGVPGVRAIGLIDKLPLEGGTQSRPLRLRDAAAPGAETLQDQSISYRAVSTGAFAALGVPLLEGRLWREAGGEEPIREVVVNRTFARRYLPAGRAVGSWLTFTVKPDSGQEPVWHEVVGVIGDIRQRANQPVQPPEIFVPYQNTYWPLGRILLRTQGDPRALTARIRETLLRLDPEHVIDGIAPLESEMQLASAESRVRTWLVAVFGLAALLLSGVGLYGVLASDVAQRQQELGVRLALGAHPYRLGWMVVRQGMLVTLVGLVAGLTAALGLGRVLANLLYGVTATDGIALLGAGGTLAVVALLASYLPARRATRLDPVVALRRE
jgi:putative ABC transport system permease protein